MKKAVLLKTDSLFLEEVCPKQIKLNKDDYLLRISLLREAMKAHSIDFTVIFGDREHFANIEYFCSYDCRFEEGILIVPLTGTPTILVGNEGMSYSAIIPFEVNRVFYRNFSLQGQPRKQEEKLVEIFRTAGILKESYVGVCGYKYFYPEYTPADPAHTFDVPAYIMNELFEAADEQKVINTTEMLTGLSGGIRLFVHSAKEIAQAEAAACLSASVFLRMMKALKPGITEYELSSSVGVGFAPLSMYPMVNFGDEHISIGLASPSENQSLETGEPCSLCYGIRGCLTSRAAIAAKDEASMGHGLDRYLFSFYGKFFEAMSKWYETLKVGATGNDLHWAVHNIIGAPEFGVTLNVGHYSGMDEWVNALSFDGSNFVVLDGAYMQVDIIASAGDPVRLAICEDAVIVAGKELRDALSKEYPETYQRIMKRQQKIREVTGIEISVDVLPLSNLNAVMFPFMMNLDQMFGLR